MYLEIVDRRIGRVDILNSMVQTEVQILKVFPIFKTFEYHSFV